jgi:hypothetical protein
MFHPFLLLKFRSFKVNKSSTASLFYSKDGSNFSQEVIDWQHDYDHIGANISLHLHLNAGLIGSLPIADNTIQLGFAVKYLFEFHHMLCNLHAHISIGVFAIAQFGFYCISAKMISIPLIGYDYCW